MTKELQNTLIEILTYFKSGLDDVQAGTFDNERQNMQDEIDFSLPLVEKLIIADVVVPKGTVKTIDFERTIELLDSEIDSLKDAYRQEKIIDRKTVYSSMILEILHAKKKLKK